MSTPNVGGDVYSTILSATDENGKRLCNSMILGDPCDLCRTTSTPEKCTHKLCELAQWKDPERFDFLRRLYTVTGNEHIFRAELGTMMSTAQSTEFSRDMYIDFVSSEPRTSGDQIESVYIGVDPAYGGQCDFAITAIGQVTSGTRPGFQVRSVKKNLFFFPLLYLSILHLHISTFHSTRMKYLLLLFFVRKRHLQPRTGGMGSGGKKILEYKKKSSVTCGYTCILRNHNCSWEERKKKGETKISEMTLKRWEEGKSMRSWDNRNQHWYISKGVNLVCSL